MRFLYKEQEIDGVSSSWGHWDQESTLGNEPGWKETQMRGQSYPPGRVMGSHHPEGPAMDRKWSGCKTEQRSADADR